MDFMMNSQISPKNDFNNAGYLVGDRFVGNSVAGIFLKSKETI